MTTLTLQGRKLEVARGTALRDVLFEEGIEFPCGGRGRCGKCRVRVTAGALAPQAEDRVVLSAAALAQGWRLACRHRIDAELALDVAQWQMAVLSDERAFAFAPQLGLGIAIDLGTTTIAAQLVDRERGRVRRAKTALNAQVRYGDDVLSRLDAALNGRDLTGMVRDQLGQMAQALADGDAVHRIVIVGNTAMHHLFCGFDVRTLATHPFAPTHPGRVRCSANDLGWPLDGPASVEVLPCIGGMVGADILAGVMATRLYEQPGLTALIDLGTNGEVLVARDGRLLATSTAAGPAFEGARISCGMRAASGAISEVTIADGSLACRVIGGGEARGLCGSGLVDAVTAGLELGRIDTSGHMAAPLALAGRVVLQPRDVRELQLAKAAIAAGLRLLTARFGAEPADIDTLHLAGAFGNTVSRVGARRIGLLKLPVERISPAGNTALLGAKLALFEDEATWDGLARRIEHVPLNEEPTFEEVFAQEMQFPD
jgi:uncharacterized 2Fe-2S/4Fe-4S cluster protein (DUF4445 family)